jgi:heavy metal translocating P-type ATPase
LGDDEHEESTFDAILAPTPHARRWAVILLALAFSLASFARWWRLVGLPFDAVGLLVALVAGWPIWREAWEAVRERQINMEITMTLGVAAALAIGQIATALLIVSFVLFSQYLEELTRGRGRNALDALLRAAPETATVWREGAWASVPASDARAGDRILVRPGERVPADGRVAQGEPTLDESALTGEPFSRPKRVGDAVLSGALNGNVAFEMEATRDGEESTYARIIRLVREASERRGGTQRLADRVAQGIVYVVLAAALVTFLLTRDPVKTVSVVLVAGACGVAAGTPLAILAVTARSARRGVIVKGGETIEALARVDTVVFDKTGTLTHGQPVLSRARAAPGRREEDVLRPARSVEQGSDHPIARAIRAAPGDPPVPAAGVEYRPGLGVLGSVDKQRVLVGNRRLLAAEGVAVPPVVASWEDEAQLLVLVAVDGAFVGALELRDELRPSAREAVRSLERDGLRVVMLTGDREASAARVARELGIEHRAQLLPDDKIRIVEEMRRGGRRVCFVGDGINDAPALAAADVGVAMRSGSEAAIETADATLMGDDLTLLPQLVRDAKRAQRTILFNFAGTLVVDGAGLALATVGLLGPVLAACVHVGSELVFILNSARLFTAGMERARPSRPSTRP